MGVLAGIRSALALVMLLLFFAAAGFFQRLVVWPAIALAPNLRYRIMGLFMRPVASVVFAMVRLGGGRVQRKGTIPTEQPVLILANHQSILDIPTAVLLCYPNPPQFVARRRYGRFIPMISLIARLIRSPLIDPEDDRRGAIHALRKAAREQATGLLLFPEGHRTPDGEVGTFEAGGIRVVLKERRMAVYLIVTDGFWTCARLVDIVFNMRRVCGRTEVLGPFEPPESGDEMAGFVDQMRRTSAAHLARLRDRPHADVA